MSRCSDACCGCSSSPPTPADTLAPASPDPTAVALTATGAQTSAFDVPGMDCPAEERLIRLALQDLPGVQVLRFDLTGRQLQVRHQGPVAAITAALQPLGMGARWRSATAAAEPDPDSDPDPGLSAAPEAAAADESRVLRWLLGLNAAMFVVELLAGWWAQSTGLIADALDMFADAAVYSLALYAVGRSDALKVRAAHLAGWLQLGLALLTLAEVLRRFVFGSEPVSALMMGMGGVALIANAACLILIARQRQAGAHMQASYIFSSSDVIANAGVILAGALVAWTGSRHPDLVIGLVITGVVMNGARRILRLG